MKIYKYFASGVPAYLARHYWWAYLWPVGVWFFDHKAIINTILFGQYQKLLVNTVAFIKTQQQAEVLQLACVYGSLSQAIGEKISPRHLHIADVSQLQLETQMKKCSDRQLLPARMDAESLAYRDNAFSTLLIFFLLHELPADVRRRVLAESMRVVVTGGSILCTEYGYLPASHPLYRFILTRGLLTWLEPFLAGFWRENLIDLLNEQGRPYGKYAREITRKSVFGGFYQVVQYEIHQHDQK